MLPGTRSRTLFSPPPSPLVFFQPSVPTRVESANSGAGGRCGYIVDPIGVNALCGVRPGVRPLPGGAGSVKFLTSVADVLTAAEHKTFVEVFAAVQREHVRLSGFVQSKAQDILAHFDSILTASPDEICEPSSWWSESMVMLKDDPEIPFELRLYCNWRPFKERCHSDWHFFAPHHVFRLPIEYGYVIAQRRTAELMFSCQTQTWTIVERGAVVETATTFSGIAQHL